MIKEAGLIANFLSGVGKFFSRQEYHERVEDSLLSTTDALVYWLKNPAKKNGTPYSEQYIQGKVSHYLRQYEANRKKLK